MTTYWHSVFLHQEKCTGCTNCMHRCPTHAIRVIDGKARIMEERCIDCGECIKVCPYHAKDAKTDQLSDLAKYRYNVALPTIAMYGQFPIDYDMQRVFNTFLRLGFNDVFDVALAADTISAYLKEHIEGASADIKPLISTYCPAVTRLIQIRYPALIDSIIPIESPSEIAARQARKRARELTGFSDDEIGVFLITQCPAKVTSIKRPIGLDQSQVSGAISFKGIYPRILKLYETMTGEMVPIEQGSGKGIGWGRVGGQSYAIDMDRYIAVDGIDEVTKVLDKVDMELIKTIEFIEGYACVTGCVGGPLNVENPFVAKSRIRTHAKREQRYTDEELKSKCAFENIIWTNEIEPHPILKLDKDFKKAIVLMSKIEALTKQLPGLDCGACGSPTCRVLAEDVVLGRGKMEDCIVKRGLRK
jgi:iron only hydrogenase large subunit-like protein